MKMARIKRSILLPECEHVKWNICWEMSIKKPNVEQHSNKTWLYDYHFKKWRGNVLVILPLIFCVLFVYRCLSFLFWQMCCLSFDRLRLLVSTNFFLVILLSPLIYYCFLVCHPLTQSWRQDTSPIDCYFSGLTQINLTRHSGLS